ncbi:MAG: BREX-1 system adenine-specific DNA-methyltransferase PglX [Methylacidiphilales bacterium]|nr:BREX-1 system adenine-specific DNA-methyltransferase PglX [Candidatus Methylacidiphilales bacterium]
MSENFDAAFAGVKQLVETFEANKQHYLSQQYQEAEARRDFIDKFLILLGWDVNHDQQKNPYEQEVKVERKEHGVSQRRADYAFYLAPNFRDVKFYVEAKKPFGDIATADNYFQTIRYGWNSQTPIAVLFDFAQLEIVDCRYKPDLETALQRNVKKFHYTQYADQEAFAEIYWLFSREAVAHGSLEKFAETLPKKTRGAVQRGLFKGGWQSIDESFLEELDTHRDTLARLFKNRNPHLDGDTLTEITQRTLDRLVFIRFLEDKLIEPQYLVSRFGERGNAWGDFIATSRRLDGIYNGIVFKKNDILDFPSFKVDDDQFAQICEELSHINSPYDFNAIPIHILGSIYERFLGKVIVATEKRARVEEKPEVRKAGGVYYTPEYIVRYIVESTVGQLIAGKTPDRIAGMRFADIACGSGSFLLGIYDLLIRYHTKYYNDNPGKAKKGETVEREDGVHLSLQKKREILLNNIYGVDIDTQAVEVAQLSLYLKLLQDETPASARQYLLDFEQQALLPSLSKNIVCGNSLIGRDVTAADLFENGETERKLNPMDFEDAFPQIMKRGGFDAIVGNPPYIRIQIMQESRPQSSEYLKQHYAAAAKGNYDVYVVFTERGLRLLNQAGMLGFILPHKFFNAQYGKPLRTILSEGKHLAQIVHFGSEQVFMGATTYTCLLILSKKPQPKFCFAKVDKLSTWYENGRATEGLISASRATGEEWNFNIGNGALLFERLRKLPLTLGDVADVFVGLQTSADDVFIMDLVEAKSTVLRLKSKIFGREVILEQNMLFPLVSGTDVKGFGVLPERQYILFPYQVENGRAELIPFVEISRRFPQTAAYLLENRKRLEEREKCKFKDAEWYRFGRSQNLGIQQKKKICVPRLVDQLCAAYDESGTHFLDNVDVGGVTFKLDYQKHDLLYLLALLNSRLLRWYFPFVSAPFRGGWMSANRQFLSQLPFRQIDFSKPADKARHAKIASLAESMQIAKKQLGLAQSDRDKDFYENKCTALDRQIDSLVYELYGLSEDEIKIVEESVH